MNQLYHHLQTELEKFFKCNHCHTAILGLSGGIDSALCAVLAADALGGKNVTAIMMRSKYTSPLSLEIAREIANLNHLDYHETDIQHLIDENLKFLTTIFNQEPKSVVVENMQARIRGKILMAWSNQFGGLVLACGNKSEAATGYCTLYGDTCGAVMPLGDIYKTEVFALAKWRNSQTRVLPSEVLIRAPSAELALNQIDENTLPPYDKLDKILKLYLEEQNSLSEITAKGFDFDMVNWIIERYQAMAFKRNQMPPAICSR